MNWLREHDRGFAALRRAGRTALVMPAMFAIGDKVIGNPALATFAAFGSFAMLLLVDFSGPMRDRLLDQATLAVACVALISLATLASRWTVVAALGMVIVGFAILFAGVVSSVLAGATTTLLLAFILPVSLQGPASSIPDRIAGWGLASGASLIAIAVLWPAPTRDPVRSGAIAACRAVAARLRTGVAAMRGDDPTAPADHERAIAEADRAVQALHAMFFATPYRPTGLTTAARAIVRLVDELRWLNAILEQTDPPPHGGSAHPEVRAVTEAAAASLEATADILDAPRRPVDELHAALGALRGALAELEAVTTTTVPGTGAPGADARAAAQRVVTSLDPSFRAQELSFVVSQIGRNTDLAAAAERRSWPQRLLGRQPPGLPGPWTAAQERAGAHVERHSLWLHNSLRGAVGLGLAVLVAGLTGVEHGFWVVFGTLSVLRSSALSTGQNIVRGLLGTTAGFVVGALLVSAIGTDTTLLWILLPFVVLFAGLAPATISFAAGQAAFTLVLFILFNILAPTGWRIGLVRIEDVLLGSAVSLAVGVLFWPRGAAAALGRALSEAYADCARYLADAVAYAVSRCDAGTPSVPAPTDAAIRAAAASRRLDDTFRGYLAERGAKPVALGEMTTLVTGVAGLRLAGDAVLDLWTVDEGDDGDRAAAREELLATSRAMTDWYGHFARSLAGGGSVPDALAPDAGADGRLVDAVGADLAAADGHATATAVRMIWTGDHLDAARRLQESLVAPARIAVAQGALGQHRAVPVRFAP